MTKPPSDRLEKRITFSIAIMAFALSAYNFINDNFFHQHVLRAAVVSLEEKSNKIGAKILLINGGKHHETLYQARFLFNGRT
jgi:hypothetical protein